MRIQESVSDGTKSGIFIIFFINTILFQ